MKAFAVLESYESTGGVIFATTAVAARRRGADNFADGDFSGVSCRRAPWADAYASDGVVPASVMVAHGWRYEGTCGHMISEDELSERGLTCHEVVGHDNGGAIFCSKECEEDHERVRSAKAEVAADASAMIRLIVARRFPGVAFPDDPHRNDVQVEIVDGHHGWSSVRTTFSFPGMKIAPASAEIGSRHGLVGPPEMKVWCCSGDREAFEAFASASAGR